jgi:UDP-glucose 4-epimerase
MLEGKRIAITGGSGYLGTNLTRALIDKNQVKVIDRVPPVFTHANLSYSSCDVLNQDALTAELHGVDVLFHRAGLAGNLPSMRAPMDYYNVNVIGTLHALEACKIKKVQRFVFDSTEMVYGVHVKSPVGEDQIPIPSAIYGATKLICEDSIRLYARKFGLSCIIFRYCRARDIEKPDVVTAFAKKYANSEEVSIFDEGRQSLDFVDVSDLVRANIAGAESSINGETFNVTTGEHISIKGILTAIETRGGKPFSKVNNKNLDANPPSAEHQFGPQAFYMSGEKSKRLLGWTPSKSLTASIHETIDMVLQAGRK